MANINLSTPIQQISGIGVIFQKKLKKLGIQTVRDVFYHFPHRYEDFSNIISISKVKLNKTVCVQGKILEIKNKRTWKKKMFLTQSIIQDNTGAIKVIWFRQPYLVRALKKGDNVCLAGKIVLGDDGAYISNPAYEKISILDARQNSISNLTHTGRIVSVYPETEGLSSRWLR